MTDKLTTIQSLRDRVAKATGPDRELDAAIAETFGVNPDWSKRNVGYCDGSFSHKDRKPFCWVSPAYTSSIDAALAWAERVFPRAEPQITKYAGVWVAELHMPGYHAAKPSQARAFKAPTPVLAIILAGLDALIAKKEKTDGTQ